MLLIFYMSILNTIIGDYILDYKVSRIGPQYYTITHVSREPSTKKASGTGASGRGGAFTLVTPTIRQEKACFVNRYVSPPLLDRKIRLLMSVYRDARFPSKVITSVQF